MKTKEYIQGVFYVYCIENSNKDIIYIGYTNDPKRRFNEHRRFSSNKGLRHYLSSWNEIEFRIIAEFFDQQLAMEYEEFLIKKYHSLLLNKKAGYERI